MWGKFSEISPVSKNEKFSHHLTKKIFREINSLVISVAKTLLSRTFLQKTVRVPLFPVIFTAQCGKTLKLLSLEKNS